MEPQPGIDAKPGAVPTDASGNETQGGGLLDAVGRPLGFLMFALPAMVIVAATLLLPAYHSYQQSKYELACAQVQDENTKALINAMERINKLIPENPAFITRVKMAQDPVEPVNEIFLKDPKNPPRMPAITLPKPRPFPAPPRDAFIEAHILLGNQKIQRGLILLAVSALLAGVLLFWPKKQNASD